MSTTISATTTNPSTTYPGSTCTLRLYSSISYASSDGTVVMAGTTGSGSFFKSVDCTIAAGIISIPSFTIPSTSDGLDLGTARYTAVFFDSDGVQRDVWLDSFVIPTSLVSPTTWAALRIYKYGNQPLRDTTVYTKDQTNAQIALANGTLNDASNAIKGRSRLSVAPVLASDPIAVGNNDPRLTGSPTYASSSYASLNAAVTAIGSTPGTLFIEAANFPSGNSTTVPSTLVLDWGNVGSLLMTTGQTATIQSDGTQWPVRKLFYNALSGQGTVAPTGVREPYPQWWGVVADGEAYQDGVTNATTTFTSATANFAAEDVGKTIILGDSGVGSGATATATVVNGAVTAFTVTAGGSGYTVAPTVTVIGGGGQLATGTAALTGDAVTSITVTNGGSGYTQSAPAVLIERKAHSTTIASRTNATTIVLAAAPPRSASGIWFTFGTDNTTAMQAALTGTVGSLQVPQGSYLFTGSLTVPQNVTVQGTWSKASIHSKFFVGAASSPVDNLGTTFLITNDPGKYLSGTPFMSTTGWNAGIRGITFFHPLQKTGSIPNAFPPAVMLGSYGDSALASGVTVENCEFVNSFHAIYVHNAYPVTIKSIYGDAIAVGLYADKSPDVSYVSDVYWGPGFRGSSGALYTWSQSYGVGFVFGRVDLWMISNCFDIYHQIGFLFIETATEGSLVGGSAWAILNSNGADNDGFGIVVKQASQTLGHGIIFEGFNAQVIVAGAVSPQGLRVESTVTGQVTVAGITVRGAPLTSVVVAGGPFTMTGAHLPDGTVGNGAVILAGPAAGSLNVNITNSHIAYSGGPSFVISDKVRGSIATNVSGRTRSGFSSGDSTDVLIFRDNVASDGLVPDSFGASTPRIHRRNANQLLFENVDASTANAEIGVYAGSGNTNGSPILSMLTDSKVYRWYIDQADNSIVFRDTTAGVDRWRLSTAGVLTYQAASSVIFDNGTASAVAGAATLSKQSGVITSEALTTAAGSDYVLTLTNSLVAATSRVFASVNNGTNTVEGLDVQRVTPGAGSVVIRIRNTHAASALNGTIRISFVVF